MYVDMYVGAGNANLLSLMEMHGLRISVYVCTCTSFVISSTMRGSMFLSLSLPSNSGGSLPTSVPPPVLLLGPPYCTLDLTASKQVSLPPSPSSLRTGGTNLLPGARLSKEREQRF